MIYLDNAATTIRKAPGVAEAMVKALSGYGNAGRGVHEASLEASRAIYQTRRKLADLFHADAPSHIAFTANATQALNTAIFGTLAPGDHVVTTAREHNSVLRPLYCLQEKGVFVTIVPAEENGRVREEALIDALLPQTRAVVCAHGSNVTGDLIDLEKIGSVTSARGILLIVDAAQTAGCIPIDVQKMQIDILCFTGHKGLRGPQGTGGIWVRGGVKIRPLMTGGTGVRSFLTTQPPAMPTLLEAGTLNTHGIAGLDAALTWLLETGPETVCRQEQDLLFRFYDQVRDIPGVTVYGGFQGRPEDEPSLRGRTEAGKDQAITGPELRAPVLSLNIDPFDSGEAGDILMTEYGIATRTGAHCAPLLHTALGTAARGAVRFSFSCANTADEVDAAAAAVRGIALSGANNAEAPLSAPTSAAQGADR